jgi:AbrB family looped-hinge helix DNA binding protein
MKWQTTIRTRGRVLLPKELRDRKGWSPGTLFKVEECEEGIFLRYVDESPKPRKASKKHRQQGAERQP